MSEPKMVDKKPCWTTTKEEADKLVDKLSEVCFEYGKNENNEKLLDVFYATKALKNYVGIMQGRIELLTARIAELEEKQRWRVVADGELPEVYRDEDGDFIPFLVCEGDGVHPFKAMYNGKNWWAGIFVPDITHWMPLPELPEVEE